MLLNYGAATLNTGNTHILNAKPIAVPGSNFAVVVNKQYQLDGTGSNDGDNDSLTYLWIASAGSFDDEESSTPTYTAPSTPQPVTITLVVNDGVQDSDEVSITGTILADTTAPTISLNPPQTTYSLTVGSPFVLPVATLTDNVDSSRVISPTSNDYEDSVGTYSVVYSGYKDAAGNTAQTVTVTINVSNIVVTRNSKSAGQPLKITLTVDPIKINLTNGGNKMYQWLPAKDPDETEYYPIEIDQEWLIGREIEQATFSVPPESQLVVSEVNIYRNVITPKISGGVEGTHPVEVTITSDGRVRQKIVYLEVTG